MIRRVLAGLFCVVPMFVVAGLAAGSPAAAQTVTSAATAVATQSSGTCPPNSVQTTTQSINDCIGGLSNTGSRGYVWRCTSDNDSRALVPNAMYDPYTDCKAAPSKNDRVEAIAQARG
jgi:hypothetical protein